MPSKRTASKAGKAIAIVLILIWSLVPIAFIVVSAFKPSADIFAVPPKLAFAPTLKHFVDLWANWRGFFTGLVNSAIVTAGATLLALGAGFIGIMVMETALYRVCPLYTVLDISTDRVIQSR